MSGKKAKEKRFEEKLDGMIQSIKKIEVKPGEVLLIELDKGIDMNSFGQLSKAFKAVFEKDRVKIIFGPAKVIKNMTAIGGDVLKKMPDSNENIAAINEAKAIEIRKEKREESFEDFQGRLKEGGM